MTLLAGNNQLHMGGEKTNKTMGQESITAKQFGRAPVNFPDGGGKFLPFGNRRLC